MPKSNRVVACGEQGGPTAIGGGGADKAAPVAFMKTLTGDRTPFEERCSDPFRRCPPRD